MSNLVDVPITLQLDPELIADALMARLRTAFIAALASSAGVGPAADGAPAQAVKPASLLEQVAQPAAGSEAVSEPTTVPVSPSPAAGASTEGSTLDDWLVEYDGIVALRPYKPQTLKNHRSTLKHVRRLWGAMPVRAIKPRHITAELQAAFGTRASMARRVMDQLRDVMQEAVINEWADHNPVADTRKPRVRVLRKRLGLDVAQDMLRNAEGHRQAWVRPMILLALVTGQRRADLAKMCFDDIRDGHLHVEQQKQAGKGYGARIAIPLSLRLDAIGMTVGDVVEICRTHAKPGPTLLRRADGKSIELSSLSTRFHEVIKDVRPGVYAKGEWPSLHEMRSLSERLYRAQGIDTQTLLGHASQEMTDKYNDDRGLTAKEWKRLELV